ncbi:hypothetical protein PoB_007587000 [Plakobranchus ocellatus]|uniref:Secreted protein n=1 Tax=Plakobranchus ocellatus TaxID=259542 RepID=A0AAV4DZ77_9GAST|nr:hypothetical protein PoB_007587000 [Plakobranchus ocellatus]
MTEVKSAKIMRSSFLLALTMRMCDEVATRDLHADLYITSPVTRHCAEDCEIQAVADDRFSSNLNLTCHPL